MTPEQTTAFVKATEQAFRQMMGVEITRTDTEDEDQPWIEKGFDVSAIIGLSDLSGDVGLSVVMSFPESVARKAVSRILGIDDLPTIDEDVADGVGELVNVLAGVAKKGLGDLINSDWTLTLPTVVLGSQHRIFRMRDVTCHSVRFSSEIGEFLLQVLLRPSPRQATVC